MKRLFRGIFALLLVLVVVALTFNRLVKRQIETEILIEAPADRIWMEFTDFTAYPEWNPFIVQISGTPAQGETLNVTLQPPGQQPAKFQPTILVAQEGREFRWKGKLFIDGVFDGEHYFLLESLDNGQTQFIQGEKFTGLFSGLISAMILEDTEKGFEAMNRALKERVEVPSPQPVDSTGTE